MAYIEENGNAEISLHEISRRLGVKTPSLYNYIKNTKELQYEVFQYAIEKFVDSQEKAVENKHKDDAVKAFADAYYMFATNNKGLYKLIMSMPSEDCEMGQKIAVPLLNTVLKVLSEYDMSETEMAHWQRVFRAILHGFISQENLGYFYYFKDVEIKKSLDIAVQCFIDGLNDSLQQEKNKTYRNEGKR